MWYVASNRDETKFEDPERFDVERNPDHQGFGAGGRHFCLGAALARLEGRIVLEELVRRTSEWEISAPVERWASAEVRGPSRLELAFANH